MTKYKADLIDNKIKEIDAISETAVYITFNEIFSGKTYKLKRAKKSDHYAFFDTREEAKQYLIDKVNNAIKYLNERAVLLKDKLKEIEKL